MKPKWPMLFKFSDQMFIGVYAMRGPCPHLMLLNFVAVITFGAKHANYKRKN
jgi:hypothetical protein